MTNERAIEILKYFIEEEEISRDNGFGVGYGDHIDALRLAITALEQMPRIERKENL